MKIHELPGDMGRQTKNGAPQKRKRVGRGKGSGTGGRAGKGNKGAQARSGGGKSATSGFEGGQMPLFRRVPKRGFKNPNRVEYAVVNLGQLNEKFSDGDTVDAASLLASGLVSSARQPVKLLGKGSIERKLTINVDKVSASAAKAIEAAGGALSDEAETTARKAPGQPRRKQQSGAGAESDS